MKVKKEISRLIPVLAMVFLSLPLFGAPLPTGATRKETLSHKQVQWLVGHAETPAQHAQLAAYYRQQADHCFKQAKEHNEMAATYPKLDASKVGDRGSIAGEGHCRYWSEVYTKRGQQNEALAAVQEKMAQGTAAER